MKKVALLAVSGLASVAMAIAITSPAFAWHPQGKITKTVQDKTTNSQVSSATEASSALTVAPGDVLQYTIVVRNAASPAANHDNDMAYTVMTDSLPAGIELVSNPSERQITETIGTILPGDSVTKQYQVKVTDTTDGDVITNKACFTGNSIVKDNPQSGCSTVVVKVHVPKAPVYSCNLLSVIKGSNRKVTISKFDETAENGAVFKDAIIDWGDKSSQTITKAENQSHTYDQDGTYKIAATARFSVNGKDKTATSAACTASFTFTTPKQPTPPKPKQLVNTGAGNIILPALLATAAGYALYAFSLKRRLGNN